MYLKHVSGFDARKFNEQLGELPLRSAIYAKTFD
jgi:hypothetical protein